MTAEIDRFNSALVGRYRLERQLGEGGMAKVYLCDDLKHHRKVALKVLRSELAASLGHDRFLREITTTAHLRHPHILPLYDSGEVDGLLFYAMPLVEGESLRDRLDREKQLPVDDAVRIAREVADALQYAHGRRVVHRDIKPENILLESGHAVVADFGIARAVTAAGPSSLTQLGTAIGTPAYMSPEQAAGDQELDGRSDQYALACLTYEMLSGQPPFTGPTVESVVRQHFTATPVSVTQIRQAVPANVDLAIQRALAKNPADRFPEVAEFAAALADGTSQVPNATVPWRRRTVATLCVVGILAAAVVGWQQLAAGRRESRLDPDVIAVMPFRVGGNSRTEYLRESMLDLLQARLNQAKGLRIVEPRTLLAAWRRAGGDDRHDLTEEASRALARSLGASRVLLGSAVSTPTELTLSGSLLSVAEGKVLAYESVAGMPDSVATMVNSLTAKLLIEEAGEGKDRGVGLAGAPLDALQDYLAGRKAGRRGDYFSAMDLYARALSRDSTFVLAAFAMVGANVWQGTVFRTDGIRLIPRVWQMRERLGARDVELFLAMPMVGPNFPRPSTSAEIIAQAERAASASPDSPEHWLLLGQLLSHYGAAASRTDWATRSMDALDRAIALDSNFTLAIGDRLFTAIELGDRKATAQFAKLLEGRVASGFTDDMILWAAARALGDSAAAVRWRDRRDGLSRNDYLQKLTKIALHSAAFALPLDDARWAVSILRREAGTEPEQIAASLGELALLFAEGRDDHQAIPVIRAGPQWVGTIIQQSALEGSYRPLGTATLAAEAAGSFRVSPGGEHWPPTQDCFAALHRIAGGDRSDAVAASRRLTAFASSVRPPFSSDEWQQIDFRVCPLLLQVLAEPLPSAREARPALDRLDSLMRAAPRGYMGAYGYQPTALANFTIARYREAQGDIAGALAAIRRREVDYFPSYLWSLPAFLRQEGRLSALAGDATAAASAYDRYLVLRTSPAPAVRPQRDSVVAERAALARTRAPSRP